MLITSITISWYQNGPKVSFVIEGSDSNINQRWLAKQLVYIARKLTQGQAMNRSETIN